MVEMRAQAAAVDILVVAEVVAMALAQAEAATLMRIVLMFYIHKDFKLEMVILQ